MPTAFSAEFGSGPMVVAVCAEYDALPGIGHACGHNIIAASAVGAGLGLAPVADERASRCECSVRRPKRAVAGRSPCSTPASSTTCTRP